MKVFILDDNKELADAMKESLDKYNSAHEVYVAYTGKAALEMLPVNLPDVMFIDINLPDMNGLDIMKEIKGIEPDIQVIIMSAYGTQPNIIRALQYGAVDFIPKPLHMKQIYDALKSASERRKILLDARNAVAELIKVKQSKMETEHTFALLDRIIMLKNFQKKLNYITSESSLVKTVIDEFREILSADTVSLYRRREVDKFILYTSTEPSGKKVKLKEESELYEQISGSRIGGFLNDRKTIVSVVSFEDYDLGFIKCERKTQFGQYELEMAEMLSMEIAVKAVLIDRSKRIDSQMLGITFALMSLVGVKSGKLKRNFEEVSALSTKFGEYIKIPFSDVEMIRYVALMYNLLQGDTINNFDISGDVLDETMDKLASGISLSLPEEIINDKLSEIAQQMEFLESTKALLYAVNEHYDGSGPQKMKGDDIPYNARIIAITNTFVNLSTSKDYREGLSTENVIQLMEKEKGKYFDPILFEQFERFLADANSHEIKYRVK